MDKNLLTLIGEAIDQYQQNRRHKVSLSQPTELQSISRKTNFLRFLLPSPGNVIFTILIVFSLFWAQSAGALPLPASLATSTSTISYQGRLADSGGTPLTGFYNLEFRIYDVPAGGVPLWEELWTGGNAVEVSDGLFNVMLGSIDNTLAAAINGHDELYLGITVGTDSEMAPRVQLGSVPFSMQAITVPDSSITTAKIADASVTSDKILDSTISSRKMAPSRYEDYSTTVTSTTLINPNFANTNTSLTFTCDVACVAYIQHRGLIQHTVNNGRVDVRVIVDGVYVIGELGIFVTDFEPVGGFAFVNLPAGTHDVSVQIACGSQTPAGTCTYYGDSSGRHEHLSILVFAQTP